MYERSETKIVKTLRGDLRYHRNWDQEGAIVMENPQTIKRYKELTGEHPDLAECGAFFAFTEQQFEEGKKSLIEKGTYKEGEKLYNGGNGLIGTKEGINKVYRFYDEREERIKRECEPQEVYFMEYNNYECMFGGDDMAYKVVKELFGSSAARKLRRVS